MFRLSVVFSVVSKLWWPPFSMGLFMTLWILWMILKNPITLENEVNWSPSRKFAELTEWSYETRRLCLSHIGWPFVLTKLGIAVWGSHSLLCMKAFASLISRSIFSIVSHHNYFWPEDTTLMITKTIWSLQYHVSWHWQCWSYPLAIQFT